MTSGQNIPSWLSILIVIGLGISVGPRQILPRTSEISQALSPFLSSYQVIRMQPGEIERQVRTTGELRFRFNETDYYFNLEPHDMRSPNYLAVETGPGGVSRTLPPQPVHTFKGILAGGEDTRGRFNLVDGGVEGVVYAPEGWVYVEPLRNYLPGASAGELVIYTQSDIQPGEALKCGVSLPKRLQRGVEQMTAQVEATTPTKYEFDIATEADYEYVQALGGAVAANREIEGILNQVEGVYQNELLLQLRISFQNAWTTVNDPYTATNVFDLLDEFVAYWNANFAADQDYDLAHLWTGTDHDVPQGVAYQSVACGDRSLSYGLSKRRGNYFLDRYRTPAHEIGHNLGASHPNEVLPREQSASLSSCSTSIMWPGSLEESALTFCKFSRQEIADYVSQNKGCLTVRPITFQPPTGLEIANSYISENAFARIDLTWRDNSTQETGFIVERRRAGRGSWDEIDRTAANFTIYSDGGLFPGATYVYRVRAFNEVERSAYSNEVEATTPAGPSAETHWRITTIAGNGRTDPHPGLPDGTMGGYEGDGGPALAARLNHPNALALDGAGNLYIADPWNHRVRRVDPTGTITTVAGTGWRDLSQILLNGWVGDYGGDSGPAVRARLNHPESVAADGLGNLYIADSWNHLIRRVDPSGTIRTVAGTGLGSGSNRYHNQGSYSGDGGWAVTARLHNPEAVAVDAAGNLYIADTYNHCIRRVDPAGTIATIAGVGRSGFGGDGGAAVSALLRWPRGLAVDGAGNLYIADSGNDRVRRVDPSGTITTIAGVGHGTFSEADGPAIAAVLNIPMGLAFDGAGNLYIADTGHHHIRRVDPGGIITTIAGRRNILGYAYGGYNGDSGPALEVQLHAPKGLAVDAAGRIYIADSQNHRIRVLSRPPRPPTGLRATAVSLGVIRLAWEDNSESERGFRIQRRVSGSTDWIGIGTVGADTITFSDAGLDPSTTYHYRVLAFDDTESSSFSNETSARTQEALPPTLTRFTPTTGPPGTPVTLTGTYFLGARAVRFNGVSTPRFKVVSDTSIRAFVPPGASSGTIRVVTPGGTAVSTDHFTVTKGGIRSRLFVPVVLRSQGRTPGSFFTSEMTLTNRGSRDAVVQYTYRASIGRGSGTAVDFLESGRQRIIPDAIAYLTSLGVPIGSGSAGGTLVADFSNLSSPSDAAVTVGVTTPVEEGSGRAGLAFPGLNPDGLLTGPVFITGLRQNRQDRSNVAVQNAGVAGEESITLRVTVYSGDPEAPGSRVLPDLSLPSGGFHQYNRILTEAGFDNGFVMVERVSGTAAYYAYGVINDNFNSDGSFVFPVREDSLAGSRGQTLPVIIETRDFASELTVTNFSSAPKTVDFRFVAEAVETDDDTAEFSLELEPGEQRILPRIVDWLRQEEVAGIGAAGEAFVGAVFATVAEGDMSRIVIGARTGSPDERGGQYSLFYNGVPYGSATHESAWIYGLQQNDENRSNLALVNTGEVDDSEILIEIDIYDGEGDSQPRTRSVELGPRRWHQLNGILGDRRQGYVEVRKVSGNNPLITYGVINDGAKRGQRSGDGAFLPSQ